MGITLTNRRDVHDENRVSINPGDACYYKVRRRLAYRLLSRTQNINKYKTIILPVVLYGCKKRGILFGRGNVSYKCIKANCSGKGQDLTKMT
jgi:hypothetical protein